MKDSAVIYTVKKFIDSILETYGILSRRTLDDYMSGRKWKEYISDFSECFELAYGTTKACLIFDDYNYVVKIPLYYTLARKDENYMGEWMSNERKKGVYLGISKAEDSCRIETEIYNRAKEWGLDDVFAAEEKIMTYHGIPIYAQKRIDTTYFNSDNYMTIDDLEEDDDVSDKYNEIMQLVCANIELADCDEINCFLENVNFIIDLYEVYRSRFLNIISFIITEHIDDLHNENVGYDMGGRPIIFDYSGFSRNKTED